MFSGIIEETVPVLKIIKNPDAFKIFLRINNFVRGESVSVDGVCLTVSLSNKDFTEFDVSGETLSTTTLKYLKPPQKVNIERALTLNKLIGGHLVSGHVDGMGKISKKIKRGNFYEVEISAPLEILKYLIRKGSVAVDGISLTVNDIKRNSFSITIIPQTVKNTTLINKKVGDRVNLEVDQIAKYVAKFIHR